VALLDPVKNIVILMMENRSFDHMLGYLSLANGGRTDVDGLHDDPAWLQAHANMDHGAAVTPFLSTNPYTMPASFDPPHERPNVAANLGDPNGPPYPMNGFVGGIPDTVSSDPNVRKLTMSHFSRDQVPINDFFASNFLICDRWFSSLPAGTQPNRLMAMGGLSMIDLNRDLLPDQDLVYNWLTRQGISWRVYHQGIPFFTMMPTWIPDILGSDLFRSFDDLENDIMNSPPEALPQVIFIEPTYQDAPHLGASTDDHAPSGVADGQEFLMQAYNAVISNNRFWRGCVFIVDYDEHGGFFDHVSPPKLTTKAPAGVSYPDFVSLGVRTPGFVISPFVKRGSASHATLDHTSVLKLIGEKFGPDGSYSDPVDSRGVESLSVVLNFDAPINAPPAPPPVGPYMAQRPVPPTVTQPPPTTPLTQGFVSSADRLKAAGAGPDHPKFGPLIAQLNATSVGGNP
jgi:phospholipase C